MDRRCEEKSKKWTRVGRKEVEKEGGRTVVTRPLELESSTAWNKREEPLNQKEPRLLITETRAWLLSSANTHTHMSIKKGRRSVSCCLVDAFIWRTHQITKSYCKCVPSILKDQVEISCCRRQNYCTDTHTRARTSAVASLPMSPSLSADCVTLLLRRDSWWNIWYHLFI